MQWFKNQSRKRKVIIMAAIPLLFICLCAGLAQMISPAPEPTMTPAPTKIEALPTFTPYPTYTSYPTYTPPPEPMATVVPATTPLPTETPSPAETPLPTDTPAPPTATPLPTDTPLPTHTPLPTATPVPPTNTPVPTDTPMPTPTPIPTNTPAPTPTPKPPTATPKPPTATPVPQLQPITLTGSGDTIVNVDKPDLPAIAHISTTQSGGNFAVISYDSSGNRIDLLVNRIGSYSGIRPIDFLADEHTSRFEVKADGSWRIEILPLSSARSLSIPGKISGTGDDVILLRGSTPDVAQMSHSGDSNFVVIAHCASGRDLLVNEIGSYNGSVIVRGDAMILEIVADGNWSVDISSR